MNPFGVARKFEGTLLSALFAFLGLGCGTGTPGERGVVPIPEDFVIPSGFPEPSFEPSNLYDPLRAELGRRLFFDVRLSGNNTISCGTCHVPELAFTDRQRLSTLGATGQALPRHTPTLFNLAWADQGLFWDGGAKNLESLVFGPITSPIEMNQELPEMMAELANDDDYPLLFVEAFGAPLEVGQVAMALALYVRTLVSADSKYDRARTFQTSLDEVEIAGLELVERHCVVCHSGELFTDNGFHNNGLDETFSADDEGIHLGRARVTGDPRDVGKFKTSSLRNVALTAPYMHDGRFSTLREVLEHYRSGVRDSETLDSALRSSPDDAPGVPLTDEDIVALEAFLVALSGDGASAQRQ